MIMNLDNNYKKTKIAIMSVADILNYGDTLFSFVARQEILKRLPNAEFRFFTPTSSVIEGETFYGYTRENLEIFKPTAILVIGGEVIHKYDKVVWHEMYKNINKPILSDNVSDTFFDWLDYPCFKAWFSVGVLYFNDGNKIDLTNLNKLNYIGVRGILSKKNLELNLLTSNSKIKMVPDIGWLFNRYFSDYKMQLDTLEKNLGLSILDKKYVVFNINHTSIQKHKIEKVKNILNNFAIDHDCYIFLLPIIKSYKDTEDLIGFKASHIFLLPDNLSLKETGALLMGAWFYIGSSLHAAITTMSNFKNAAIIHDVQLTKFQDHFAHSMRIDFWDNNWLNIGTILEKLKETPLLSLKKYAEYMSITIDEKLDELCNILSS